jgi:hypothetical protein
MLELLVFNKELCCEVYIRKRGFFMLHEIGLAALILKSSALKIVQIKKNTQARLGVFFYLHYLFVTQRGFEPPTVRAEI